jgi:hypothetical protein
LHSIGQPVTVAGFGILLVEPPRQPRAVQADRGMVDDLAVSRLELYSAHVA